MNDALPWPMPTLDILERATVYRPRVGRKTRTFRSMADALAYEKGYTSYPAVPFLNCTKPEITGYLDAEESADLYREAMRDLKECDE